MNKFLTIALSVVFAFSINVISVRAESSGEGFHDEIDFAEAVYDENGKLILDASELIPDEALLSQPRDVEMPLSRSNWNMVTKNLSNRTLSFFYFDESTMTSTPTRSLGAQSNVKTYTDEFGNVSLYTEPYIPADSSTGIAPRGIIGEDDRVKVDNPAQWPYRATGYIRITYKNVLNTVTGTYDTLNYRGTAFLEGPNLMVSAGHCMYGDVTNRDEYQDNLFNPRFPDEITYYPAKNGSQNPYGSIAVTEIHLEKSYYTDCEKDWGCCTLATNIGNSTGWYGKISNYYSYGKQVNTWGYPGTKNYEMWKASGTLIAFESNGIYYRYNMDTEGGQSGSPVSVDLDRGSYICGIHTYSTGSYNGGPRIDGFMFAYLNSFVV